MSSLKCMDLVRELKRGHLAGDRESFYLLAEINCPICQKNFTHRTTPYAVHNQEILERFFLQEIDKGYYCPNCKSPFCLPKEGREELLKEIKLRVKEMLQELKKLKVDS